MAPIQSSLLSRLPSSSESALARNIYYASGIIALSSFLLPTLLPARYSFSFPTLSNLLGSIRNFSSTSEAISASKNASLESWISSERSYAWKRLLDNIHPLGTDPGCVVASPSKRDPDYWYQWTRDSAMVFKVVISNYINSSYGLNSGSSKGEEKLCEDLILDYINETKKMQRMETPSGGFKTGGLGEVKFYDDGRAYTGSWGRPQNDGPALRASALIGFANHVLDRNSKKWESFVRTELYDGKSYEDTQSIIKADLDYICRVWDHTCFDLWEEVNGVHHFNMLVTIRALLDGEAFAIRLGDTDAAKLYREMSEKISDSLERFWDSKKNYILASVEVKNEHGKISWLDTGTVLGFTHSGSTKLQRVDTGDKLEAEKDNNNDDGQEENKAQYLGSDKSLATQAAIAESMYLEYNLNKKYYPRYPDGDSKGWAIGRYYEDVYDGDGKVKTGRGNPWHLCTLAHAEFLYRLIPYFLTRKITITSISCKFWSSIPYFPSGVSSTSLIGKTFLPNTKEHDDLLKSIKEKGDAYVNVVKDWSRWNGGLWEQFDRENGKYRGAPHLTWSYASFLSAIAARDGRPMFD